MNVLVTGPNEAARVALFQAIAGIWSNGEGRIIRPTLDAVLFLPQRPYSAPGTLRDVLLRTAKEHDISDAHLLAALQEAGLKSIVDRAGGLETEIDWPTKLSLGEQQQLAFIRLLLAKPTFVLLDRLSSSLSQAQVRECLRQLTEHSISYILFDVSSGTANSHDALLECDTDGNWQWRQTIRSQT